MKAEHEENTVCNAASGQNGQEMTENAIPFDEPFTDEEIRAAKSIEDLFCLKRVGADG